MSGLPGTKQACWAQVREKSGDAMKLLASVLNGNGAKAAVREIVHAIRMRYRQRNKSEVNADQI